MNQDFTKTTNSNLNRHPSYCTFSDIPAQVQQQIAAYGFRYLCQHLQERSHVVSNIDLMAVSGFCRNCLAKWLVLQARLHVNSLKKKFSTLTSSLVDVQSLIDLLDFFGYDEAAEEIYGCTYSKWKQLHSQEASEEQRRNYQLSTAIHAKHDTTILAKNIQTHFEDRTKKISTGSQVKNGNNDDHENNNKNYYQSHVPLHIQMQLEAGVFHALCQHLKERSEQVSNMDLMSVAGFCRNCLAKWLVLAARNVAVDIRNETQENVCINNSPNRSNPKDTNFILKILDSFDYDQAATLVYGCSYTEWKNQHSKKASDDQLKRYQESISIHAKHNDELLKPRGEKLLVSVIDSSSFATSSSSLLSNVCCQDIHDPIVNSHDHYSRFTQEEKLVANYHTIVQDTPFCLPPPKLSFCIKIGVLTVSDRAAAGSYATGDLAGPAVVQSCKNIFYELNKYRTGSNENNTSTKQSTVLFYEIVESAIVPDEREAITASLLSWSGQRDSPSGYIEPVHIIFTSGGTGFSPRDITPEVTADVVDLKIPGLMPWIYSVCSRNQPLACLSRGIAGVCNRTLVVNLPGNPTGIHDVLAIAMPILLHAVKDIHNNA